jgi:hypothetical protein
VDLSPDQRKEMDELNRRFLELALGTIDGDFLLLEDAAGGRLIPHTEAAKRAIANEMVPRDREHLNVILKALDGQGFTIERRKTA